MGENLLLGGLSGVRASRAPNPIMCCQGAIARVDRRGFIAPATSTARTGGLGNHRLDGWEAASVAAVVTEP